MMQVSVLKRCLMATLMCSIAAASHAQNFATPSLTAAAKQLDLKSALIPNIPSDTTIDVAIADGNFVRVRIKEEQVEHIGWPLFGSEIRRSMPSPVYDFMEYAVLDYHYHLNDNPLPLQQMKFIAGNWQTLETIYDNADFTIAMQDGKYHVKWAKDGKTMVDVMFPANYELLLHDTRRNLMRAFVVGLQRWTGDIPSFSGNRQRMERRDSTDIYVMKGRSYLSPLITSDTYFLTKNDTTIEDTDTLVSQRYVPVWDVSYAEESAANLMMGALKLPEEALIQLQFIIDVRDQQAVTCPLRQWLSFCLQQGCDLFWGLERRDENITGSLFMRNNKVGYDHVAQIVIPMEAIGKGKKILLKGRVHLFAPTTNVENLFLEP